MTPGNFLSTSIQPWLTVPDSKVALEFYKLAFNAVETYRLDISDNSVIAKLSVEGAEFWISDESPENKNFSPASLGGTTARMIPVTTDPERYFNRALQAGATEIFPIGVSHGWKLGKVVDPYGHQWEIGHLL